MTGYREIGHLTFTAPFDFEKSLHFVNCFAPTANEQRVDQLTITKAMMLDGQAIAFRVTQTDPDHLDCELFSESPLPHSVKEKALKQVSFFLSLEDDLAPFYALAQADPCFAPIMNRQYGMHHVKFLTLAEIACWSILTQHTAIPIARQAKDKLVRAYGKSISVDGQEYWAFPDFGTLRGISVDEFAAVINNQRRAEYLVNVVEALSEVDETWLCTTTSEQAEACLRRIKGIGAWSAAFILLRGLGRMEHMLLDLKPFLRIIPKVYGPTVTMAQLQQHYGQWFGYWGVYIRIGNG